MLIPLKCLLCFWFFEPKWQTFQILHCIHLSTANKENCAGHKADDARWMASKRCDNLHGEHLLFFLRKPFESVALLWGKAIAYVPLYQASYEEPSFCMLMEYMNLQTLESLMEITSALCACTYIIHGFIQLSCRFFQTMSQKTKFSALRSRYWWSPPLG